MKKPWLAFAALTLGGAASAQTAFINPVPGPAGGNGYMIVRPTAPSIFVNPPDGGYGAQARSYSSTSIDAAGGGYRTRAPHQRRIERGR